MYSFTGMGKKLLLFFKIIKFKNTISKHKKGLDEQGHIEMNLSNLVYQLLNISQNLFPCTRLEVGTEEMEKAIYLY